MGRKKLTKKQKFVKAVKDAVDKVLSNDIVVRASKTFTQTFSFTFLAGLAGVRNLDTGIALFVGAGAAGVSAVWNSLKEYKANKGE